LNRDAFAGVHAREHLPIEIEAGVEEHGIAQERAGPPVEWVL
jgi:hypothetical protein